MLAQVKFMIQLCAIGECIPFHIIGRCFKSFESQDSNYHTWVRFVKFSGFTAVGFYDKVYVFGGARTNIEGESAVFMMGENLRWIEYRQGSNI